MSRIVFACLVGGHNKRPLACRSNPTLTAEQHINTAREAIQSEKYGDAKKDLATGWMAKP
ncbi:MAG: hypothetical protein WAV20_10160 [Blastocatellia bacterium]